ncbi:dihydrofolate reductase family protein [Planococcus halotolerans]|uniref:Dihydrofolate reductase n=1 Tax=Planococcus halotolerans TaxID=2233542 RepID=A0A365KNA8_9BACL|nr:dihydrofolate reductase family protein [Planococcus halotolerans]QHJ71851.1 dihydrofolate reductase [Planococcus halotolerans]RAZ74611.1 dihydrofolate reductase [Planococcus halotolerans]
MAKVVWGMIMSVDGFINDRHGSLDKLYTSFEPNDEINAAMGNTGAVVMGRNSFESTEVTDAYADDYEFQVPLYILTHHPPARHPKENADLTITFVTDGIENAIRQAKDSAGDKDVVVLGASTGQQALKAGLVDELQIAVAPILLGKGLRFFEHLDDFEIELEKTKTIETDRQVEIWYKVI